VIRDLKYNLWDTEVGRYLGQFNDEKEALHLVRILVSHYGNEYADDLSLGCEAADGTFSEPLSGTDLLARAEAVLGDWAPESERRGEVIASSGGGHMPAGRDAMAAGRVKQKTRAVLQQGLGGRAAQTSGQVWRSKKR
jgi:hypothetical protein